MDNETTILQEQEPLQPEAAQPEAPEREMRLEIPEEDTPIGAAGGKNDRNMSLKSILGGDFLTSDFLRRQIGLLLLLVIFAIIYISNRYQCQLELIEIDRLKKELMDVKYNALTRSSELTEKSRQSHIEEFVSKEGSALQTSTRPPYLINK